MPEAGTYLLTGVGFSKDEKPLLLLSKEEEILSFHPLDTTLTLAFDTKQRYCTGWRDIARGEVFTCPTNDTVEEKYEQCAPCQKRTGFNPAFYHADSISSQQEALNNEPHILYLAHFADGLIKVGISNARRGNRRLLEQGARSALILDTFPTANIARSYEARIANLPGYAETVQLKKKIDTLGLPHDHDAAKAQLEEARAALEQELRVEFARNSVLAFDDTYFPKGLPVLQDRHDTSGQQLISGHSLGMIGSLLFCLHQDTPVFLPLKKYLGYPLTLTYDEAPIELPARQISLF